MIVIKPLAIAIALSSGGSAFPVANDEDGAEWVAGSYNQGAVVYVPSEHQVYKAVQATSEVPSTSSQDYWQAIYRTNDRRLVDDYTSSQTTATGDLVATFTPDTFITGLACMNVRANSVTVTMTTPADGLVYSKTESMVDTSGITSVYEYFFNPQEAKTDVVFLDIPIYLNATVTVTFASSGSGTAVGNLVAGQQKYIGDTEIGFGLELDDYSIREEDDYGNWRLEKGDFSKLRNYSVIIRTNKLHALDRFFAESLSSPMVWVGTRHNIASLNYGFFENLRLTMTGEAYSSCTLSIQGMR